MNTIATTEYWLLFGGVVIVLLALDLFVFHRKPHSVSVREAMIWSIVWVAVALLFNLVIFLQFGGERSLEFLTGYLIEKALAIDNLFVFVVIFSYFGIQAAHQHRVLFWGVAGALVFRALFIALGATLLTHFHWISYLFGAFLALTGLKLLRGDSQMHPEKQPLFRLIRKAIPASDTESSSFFVRQRGRILATPLFLTLVLVEISDIVFAVDSIPAIFAVTSDPFIVFTSNVFAVLGLRAMYSFLAQSLVRLRFLRYGLALVLVFVGAKMLLAFTYQIPILLSLGIVVTLLFGTAILSLVRKETRSAA